MTRVTAASLAKAACATSPIQLEALQRFRRDRAAETRPRTIKSYAERPLRSGDLAESPTVNVLVGTSPSGPRVENGDRAISTVGSRPSRDRFPICTSP
jgi:hypothetical protein